MEIYVKNSEGELKQTDLKSLLISSFDKAGLQMDNGSFEKEDHQWLGIVQRDKDNTVEVTVNITFKDDRNSITGLKVYKSKIKMVVDDENSKQII